ncbi:class I SAM-dependent methyltransferase [Streptomyces sp. KPB2]|uniref:class I SAM-dependent methyltransferase n=1 Tax=unclassified Streptomyces TaxID=2593676 RepID=UPI000F6BF398|nr:MULTISPECIES: class I SAM-dependent methyltransferase [unclassified Streptomyces]AZM79830.1 class I SAM-dependent methyltransferase [Streptomyces sp. KPB2]QKW65459.1 class I SAM-dependent methyltransferase [Streptomyces sp. NA03103]
MTACRICQGSVHQFFDFGRQPLSDGFLRPGKTSGEFFYRLAVGVCRSCTMVQLMEEVPRERMFRADYPYHSSMSVVMREHFTGTARHLLETECRDGDPLVVEIGCNDGVMLRTVAQAGVRHLGVDPSRDVAELAAAKGVRVRIDFFEESLAREVAAAEGPAQVIYAANTMCHIPYLDSVFRGVDALLAPDGVFCFEDPYLGDVVERTSFDQIYDEHFYLFSATSVRAVAGRFGFDLVDVERLPVHGGEVRYTLARSGARRPSQRVEALVREETERRIAEISTLEQFATQVKRNVEDLASLLRRLQEDGARVAAYGATAKSATVTNYGGLGPDLIPVVYDSTPAKQGLLTPGSHIPVRPLEEFSRDYPDYALLFAWNHAGEIVEKEREFREQGGKWILYVPDLHVL